MSQWQPIETAPKDGTDILLISENRKWVDVGCWFAEWRYDRRRLFFGQEPATNVWVVGGGSIIDATHWMPLPEPPKDTVNWEDWNG